jgi:hypothetical protein
MLPKIGSIGKGLATMSRRKSWKAVEPYDASSDKDDLSNASSEDAYIQTFSVLLADNAPSWSVPPSRRPIFLEKDYSSDESESILSEAQESRANQIADRLRSFQGKTNLSCSISTATTSSSTNDQLVDSVDSSQSSGSKHNQQFDDRQRRSKQGKEASSRSGWAEKKNPSTSFKSKKSNEASPPALFTPDNPPPPPPRPNNRSATNLFPPPPPPPPAPLKTDLKARRMSYGESMRTSRQLSKSCNYATLSYNRRTRRVSFSDEHPRLQRSLSTTFRESKKMSKSLTNFEASLFELKKTEYRKRASVSSTSVVVPRNLSTPSQQNRYQRKDSLQESFSSSMPNVLSDYKPKSALFHDDSEIPSPSLPALPMIAPNKSQNADDEWSEILSAVEDRTQASVVGSNGPKEASAWNEDDPGFRAESSTALVPSPSNKANFSGRPGRHTVEYRDFQRPRRHRRAVSEVEFDRQSSGKAVVHKDCSQSSGGKMLRDNANEVTRSLRETSFNDSTRFSVDSKQQEDDLNADEEVEPSSPANKEKNVKDKSFLNKIPLLQKVRNRSFNIDDDAHTAKSSNKPKYDKNGRCKKHPSIIIAKKRPFAKGWDIIQTCPRCSQLASDGQVTEDYCVGVDELLAPSNAKKYDWQLASSFTSTKSNCSNDQKQIEGASDFLAKSGALRSANSLSEAASRAISQSRINDSPSKQSRSMNEKIDSSRRSGSSKQSRNNSERIDSSGRSGSSRQLPRHGSSQFDNSRSSMNGSMEFNNSPIGNGPSSSHFDSSMNGSMNFNDHVRSRPMDNYMGGYPNQLDYSTKSEGHTSSSRQQLDYSTRSEAQASARSVSSAVVSKMPYKTPWGQTGWYSGEVDQFGVPNGEGRMRFKSGEQHIGQWTSGYSEQYIGTSSRMKRGFGINVAPWKESSYSELNYNGYSSRSVRT